MFNKNDFFNDFDKQKHLSLIVSKANSIKSPEDYFKGVPRADLILPENILIFFREKLTSKAVPSIHHRFVLICHLEGEGVVIVDNNVFHVRHGEAILIHPHQFHSYADEEHQKVSRVFITFEIDKQNIYDSIENRTVSLSPKSILQLSSLIDSYLSITQNSNDYYENETLLLASILAEITDPKFEEKNHDRKITENILNEKLLLIQKVVTFTQKNLSKNIQIKDIAKHVHISASHLRKQFADVMKIGLGTYIRHARIHRASFLIKNTDKNFTQIALECGFTSLYSFSRTFYQETNQSPTDYKKAQRKMAKE